MLRTQTTIGLQDCKLKLNKGTSYTKMLEMIIDFGKVSTEDSLNMIDLLEDNIQRNLKEG